MKRAALALVLLAALTPTCAHAQTLDWPDPAGERPSGALNPRLEAQFDEGFLTTGTFIFAGGLLAAGFFGYVYDLNSCAQDAFLSLIPFAGVPIMTSLDDYTCDATQTGFAYALTLPAQAVGLGFVLVALIAPSAVEAVYEEGAELAILPGAPGADVGLSLAYRY